MSIYVVVTYDLTVPDADGDAIPVAITRLRRADAELVVAEHDREGHSAEARGVTIVLEFASEEAAEKWTDAMGDDAPLRRVWVHPIGEAPRVDEGTLRSMSDPPRDRR